MCTCARFGAFPRAAWIALKERAVDVDYVHIDLGKGKKPEWYGEKVNPSATVPCLFDGSKRLRRGRGRTMGLLLTSLCPAERPVFESLNVAEFVHDRFPGQGNDLMPSDAHERAAVRQFMSSIDVKPLYGLLMAQSPEKQAELKTAVSAWAKATAKAFTAYSKDGPFFLGDTFSLADVALFPFLIRFKDTLPHYRNHELLPEDDADVEPLRKLVAAALERPSVKETTPEAAFFIELYAGYANKKE